MTDPEADRFQYLLRRRSDCELSEAEQHELALYDSEAMERASTPHPAERPRAIDVAKASAIAAIGAIVAGFVDPFAGVIYCALVMALWPDRCGGDEKLSFSFRIGRSAGSVDASEEKGKS